MRHLVNLALLSVKVCLSCGQGPRPEVFPSDVSLSITWKGSLPNGGGDMASPVAIGNDLWFVDQARSEIYVKRFGEKTKIMLQAGSLEGTAFKNEDSYIAQITRGQSEDVMYAMIFSRVIPDGVPIAQSVTDDGTVFSAALSRLSAGANKTNFEDMSRRGFLPDDTEIDFYPDNVTASYILYKFTVGIDSLEDPKPIATYEVQSEPKTKDHAFCTLKTGNLLFGTGDPSYFVYAGGLLPQNDSSHLGKLLLIDPDDGGSFHVVAKGVRDTQHMEFIDGEDSLVAFSDKGGLVAEEINVVAITALLNTSNIENFGWGNSADGKSREGTFYVEEGGRDTLGDTSYAGDAPVPESGFRQPYAQYGSLGFLSGRHDKAIAGPVTSRASFGGRIAMLFADMPSGVVFATTQTNFTETNARVHVAHIFNCTSGKRTSLTALAGGHPFPRFFRFPAGKAGVLIGKTGNYYELNEIVPNVTDTTEKHYAMFRRGWH